LIERPAKNLEPRAAELGLERQAPRNPLRRSPEEREHDEAYEEHLAPEDLGRVHGDRRPTFWSGPNARSGVRSDGRRIAKRANRIIRDATPAARPDSCLKDEAQNTRVLHTNSAKIRTLPRLILPLGAGVVT
jgi:hypothetical protein